MWLGECTLDVETKTASVEDPPSALDKNTKAFWPSIETGRTAELSRTKQSMDTDKDAIETLGLCTDMALQSFQQHNREILAFVSHGLLFRV